MASFISTGYFNPGFGFPYDWNKASSWYASGTTATGIPGSMDDVVIGMPNGGRGYAVSIGTSQTANSLSFSYNSASGPVAGQALNLIIGAGGSLVDLGSILGTGQFMPNGSSQATIDLINGGKFEADTASSTGAPNTALTVAFDDGAGSTLTLGMFTDASGSSSLGFGEKITNLSGSDKIILSNVTYSASQSFIYSGGVLKIFSMLNQTGTEIADLVVSLGAGLTTFRLFGNGANDTSGPLAISVACYCADTLILTPRGPVNVQDLIVGEEVLTIRGGSQVAMPVQWIGQRTVEIGRHPRPDSVLPIRITAGACGGGLPLRDLLVSPDHAIFVDGVLVPARLLVNGVSIVQDASAGTVHYYHVELERHSILLAEGLPVESYLNTGNRGLFVDTELPLVLHPEFTVDASLSCWETDACAPLAVDPAVVEPIWRRFAASAGVLPPTSAFGSSADLRLRAGNRDIHPIAIDGNRYTFAVSQASSVQLVSPAALPSSQMPWIDDRRQLGVCVNRIVLRSGDQVSELPVDHPGLADGWWAAEGSNETLWRWTNGSAALPLPAGVDIVDIFISGGAASTAPVEMELLAA